MSRLHFTIPACGCLMIAVISSCESLENSSYLHQTDATAHDHIMLVEESPPTFGYERLRALSRYYPDLKQFIEKVGKPGYYAETTNGGSRYLILYYSERREAFACRSASASSHAVEFSGPYPITQNELAILQKLQTGPERDLDAE
jgi:hypothetical protein